MNIQQIQNVYLIGIGGIGMSALARFFYSLDKKVVGYDKTPSAVTNDLIDMGIAIHFEDDLTKIPNDFIVENTLVIITPAVPKSHNEWNFFIENQFNIKKRSEVLGIITKDTYCFAVAGTHGKTTTSSILGHILYQSGVDVTAFVGGIVENYNSNLIGNGKTVTVVEADEFDRSFMHLYPDMACITSMDADHLDIYGDSKTLQDTFVSFAQKIQDKSKIFITNNLPLLGVICESETNNTDNYVAKNITIVDGNYVFDVVYKDIIIENLKFGLPGQHNLMNCLMAIAMSKTYGISDENIRNSLASFKGVKRRFAYQIKSENCVYIDDYAHHPTEINAVFEAILELYPSEKVLAIFQPHLFSRTNDFIDDFAKSLSQFSEVLLLDIYPARELPIQGVTSSWLMSKMTNKNKKLVTKKDLISEILNSDARIIVTIGAGDIGEMVADIKQALSIRIK